MDGTGAGASQDRDGRRAAGFLDTPKAETRGCDMARRLAVVLLAALVTRAMPAAAADVVPAARAGEYVGRGDVTIEGRVVAAYASPLATVLAFAPNFAGFTATILAGDRAKFPGDLDERYRGKLLQLTGPVTAYRGKPEMQVRDPSQVKIVT